MMAASETIVTRLSDCSPSVARTRWSSARRRRSGRPPRAAPVRGPSSSARVADDGGVEAPQAAARPLLVERAREGEVVAGVRRAAARERRGRARERVADLVVGPRADRRRAQRAVGRRLRSSARARRPSRSAATAAGARASWRRGGRAASRSPATAVQPAPPGRARELLRAGAQAVDGGAQARRRSGVVRAVGGRVVGGNLLAAGGGTPGRRRAPAPGRRYRASAATRRARRAHATATILGIPKTIQAPAACRPRVRR